MCDEVAFSPEPENSASQAAGTEPAQLAHSAPTKVAAGDVHQCAEKWLELYGDSLFQFALSRTKNRVVAEDLVQDTLLAAIKCYDSFRQQASTSTWLFAILRRKICDYFRQSRRSEDRDEPLSDGKDMPTRQSGRRWDDDPAAIFQNTEFQATFENCLSKLPEKLAEVFVLREMNQYAPHDIREILGINATTLSMRLHRCRQALRECLNRNWFQSE